MENEKELEVDSNDTQEENEDEESSEEQETSQENPEELKKQIKELKGQKDYYQSQYKKVKGKPKTTEYLSRDEAMLIAQGYNENDLETLNTISKGKGISLKEAKEDSLFKAYKGNVEKEEKSKEAQLGASGGSPTTGNSTGKPRDDHKKHYEELKQKYQG
jgi:predicted DsbA family dithiol-disulfide isomerase